VEEFQTSNSEKHKMFPFQLVQKSCNIQGFRTKNTGNQKRKVTEKEINFFEVIDVMCNINDNREIEAKKLFIFNFFNGAFVFSASPTFDLLMLQKTMGLLNDVKIRDIILLLGKLISSFKSSYNEEGEKDCKFVVRKKMCQEKENRYFPMNDSSH
jgi:hypothetical protein